MRGTSGRACGSRLAGCLSTMFLSPRCTVSVALLCSLRTGTALTDSRGSAKRRSSWTWCYVGRRVLGRGSRVIGQGRLYAGGKNQYRSDGRGCGTASESPMDTGPGHGKLGPVLKHSHRP
ncbi:hypothetical protein GCM10007170_14950 [Arthrobacter liuii]|uniref:Secreted protein n=1 Tax=Arthrobacter liuii TaxID=1476996 RepID=A0ABQ2APB9_9MICC|nr:hypothetical protein GCM10007170_14950 [Arthrobacter liuii]